MRPLTALVLDQALAQCARWRAEGREPRRSSINVSATNILDAGVHRPRPRASAPPPAARRAPWCVEITETTVISDFERCKRVTGELAALGCVVSIDDFGAGFTSLPYLSRLAVGELKLDRTFLSGLAGDDGEPRPARCVRATIELAHNLGLKVVAEGVEERHDARAARGGGLRPRPGLPHRPAHAGDGDQLPRRPRRLIGPSAS